MSSPSLLIVTDMKSLFAYQLEPEGVPIILERVDFECDSQTHIPLTACHPEWKENEKSRAIAEKIGEILDKYHPDSWGLACPETLCEDVADQMRHCHERKLCKRLTLDVKDIHVGNVMQIFAHAPTHSH